MSIQHLDSVEEINNYLATNDVVLIDFWAPWCNPCKAMEPTLKEASEEVSKVKMVKVNIDEVIGVSETYKVRGVPTLVLVKNNDEVGRKVGAINKSQLLSFINTSI